MLVIDPHEAGSVLGNTEMFPIFNGHIIDLEQLFFSSLTSRL